MAHDSSSPSHAGHHYVPPQSLLLKIFGALVALTLLTVATGKADWIPGVLHVPIALTIALIKAVLVAMFFMGLKHDNRINTVILSLTTLFVLVFLSFTILEVTQRGDLGNVDRMTAADRAYLMKQDSLLYARTMAETAAADSAARPDTAAAPAAARPDSAAAPAAKPDSAAH